MYNVVIKPPLPPPPYSGATDVASHGGVLVPDLTKQFPHFISTALQSELGREAGVELYFTSEEIEIQRGTNYR